MPEALDRRDFLLSGMGALAALLISSRARAVHAPGGAIPPAPVARVEIARDRYFGETLSDPYRWMENSRDRDWSPYLKGQNSHARGVLDALPVRASLLARIQALSGSTVLASRVQRAAGLTFFQQRPLGADYYRLMVREGGRDRVLIDPAALVGAGGHVSVDWWRASPDGLHLVYGLSKDGSENSVLHILNVADGTHWSERIAGTEGAHPQWLDDGSGFFYNQLTGALGTPERYLDSQARFHRLGTDPDRDPILMKRGSTPEVVYERIQMPYLITYPGARHVLLALVDVRQEFRLYGALLADALANRARWFPIAGFDDEVTGAEIDGEMLFVLANKGASRGRVLKMPISAPNLSTAIEAVPQGATVIEDITCARDGLYLKMMDGGINRLRRLGGDGRISEIALPFDGTIGAVFATPEEEGILLLLTGWLSPSGVWSVSADGRVADTGLTPKPDVDLSGYESKRLFAAASDGTQIPYTVLHRRGLALDGRAPAWISAYGAYGFSYSPTFNPRVLALLEAGAVVGYANVRGGGEFGREWHQAGQLANKPNTWRDLIAVCEDVCARRYSSPAHLAIGGRSAGGIAVGRAMTERPDLFAAVIDGVGWSNPLRYVAEQNSFGEEPEWGAISDEPGYRALKAMDSYQAVRDGVRYPAVLFSTGVTDPRVAPFHAAKMAARLQAATASGKPVLLRVDFDAGHGIGSTRAQQDREAADNYAFLLWQTGGDA